MYSDNELHSLPECCFFTDKSRTNTLSLVVGGGGRYRIGSSDAHQYNEASGWQCQEVKVSAMPVAKLRRPNTASAASHPAPSPASPQQGPGPHGPSPGVSSGSEAREAA
eukprot:EG_transcript_49232